LPTQTSGWDQLSSSEPRKASGPWCS